jgi:hypothetical protein
VEREGRNRAKVLFLLPYGAVLAADWMPSLGSCGLRWGDIAPDFSHIVFNGSIQHPSGKETRVDGSKNNKRRKFPCNQELVRLLKSIKPQNLTDKDRLVFPVTY